MESTIKTVEKRDGTKIPFDIERISFAIYKAAASIGGIDIARANRLANKVILLLEERFEPNEAPNVEVISDTIEEVLITAGHVSTARAFIVYREGRRASKKVAEGKSHAAHGPVPYRVLWETLAWNIDHSVHRTGALNYHILGGGFCELVEACDNRFEADIDALTKQMVERVDRIKLVIVAGPSSSGKTTTLAKLSERMSANGLGFLSINVDDYFRDLEYQPKDKKGDFDYETPEAIDLPLFNDHVERLLAGERVEAPRFDFHTAKRTNETNSMQLGEGELLLIDSLHGFYPGLTERIPLEVKYRIFIEPLAQIRNKDDEWVKWTDIRLMRRMMRDKTGRNVTPRQTLFHWHYVRRAEKKHILPYLPEADFVLNGAIPYELSLYKPHLFDFFAEILDEFPDDVDDPQLMDAILRARRVHSLLDGVLPVKDDSCVPKNSLIREFIGGSIYH